MLKGGNNQKKSVIDLRNWDLDAESRPKRPLDLRERVPETQVPSDLAMKRPRPAENNSFRRRARDAMSEPVHFYESLPGYFDTPLRQQRVPKKIKLDWLLIGLVVGGMLLGIIINVVQGAKEGGGSFNNSAPRVAERQEGSDAPDQQDRPASTESNQQPATIPPAQNNPASSPTPGTGGP